MKSVLALLLVASLAVSVFGQVPTGSSGAARLSPAIIAQLAARGGGGGLNNLLALSAITGQMGDSMRDYYLCNSLMRGRGGSNLLCLSSLLA